MSRSANQLLAFLFCFCIAARSSADVVLFEDFDDSSDETWGGGSDSFSSINGVNNLSNSPHSGVIGGGGRYGGLVGSLGASPIGGPLISASYALTNEQLAATARGTATIDFSGWLASEVGDNAFTFFQAQLFSNDTGTGTPFQTLLLANGSSSDGVADSVDSSGGLGAAWNIDNWSLYETSQSLDSQARSIRIVYNAGGAEPVTDRAFADQVTVSITATAIPEPSAAIVGLLLLAGATSRRTRRA